jgi:hypothetical protein
MTKTWICCFFLLSASAVAAQWQKIDTDRPDQTESAVLVPKNYFQGEFGFNKENTSYRNYTLLHPAALLKYGFKKFELRLETTCLSTYELSIPDPKRTTGIVPVEIGCKAALWEEKKFLPKTSLIVHIAIPAFASPSFQSDKPAPSFRFTMQHTINTVFGIGSNAGAEWDGFSTAPIWLYTFSPNFNLGEKWYAYIEVFGFIQKDNFPQHSLDGGIAYYISPDVKIDLSAGVGLNTATPQNYAALGFSFRVNTKRQ